MNDLKTYDYSKEELATFKQAVIETAKGTMTINLFPEETPNTVANFVSLIKDGFYDGLTFHRVIPGFVAQGGCPQGSGIGGPGWSIACECDNQTHKHQKGSLSMAHAGKDTGGSQFFICFEPQPHLDGGHTVFGEIDSNDAESLKVLDNIQANDVMVSVKII